MAVSCRAAAALSSETSTSAAFFFSPYACLRALRAPIAAASIRWLLESAEIGFFFLAITYLYALPRWCAEEGGVVGTDTSTAHAAQAPTYMRLCYVLGYNVSRILLLASSWTERSLPA